MTQEGQDLRHPHCDVFSPQEILSLRNTPTLIKVVIAVLLAFIAVLFLPALTVMNLSSSVGDLNGKLSIIMDWEKERRTKNTQWRKSVQEDIRGLKSITEGLKKSLYWTNRNSREANEGVSEMKDSLIMKEPAHCQPQKR